MWKQNNSMFKLVLSEMEVGWMQRIPVKNKLCC